VDDAGTLVSMGSMFLSMGDPDYATQCLLRATGLDKTNADAYYYLGLAAAGKGYFDDAAKFLARALNIDAAHVGALKDCPLAHLAAGDTERATDQIARSRAALPKDSDLRMLDYSVRLTRLIDRLSGFLRRLDPRRVLHRRQAR
jgi:tetratricopeptide (TPR) repeat protein